MATLHPSPRTTPPISVERLHRVVRSRALRHASRLGADPQDVEDLAQDVVLVLLKNDARMLRQWKQSRHLSFSDFVGSLAERQIARRLRSQESRRAADKDWTYSVQSSRDQADTPEAAAASREVLGKLRQRLGERVTQRGLRLFDVLMVDQRSVASTISETGISAGAIYVWRSRLRKLVRSLGRSLESDATSVRASSGRRRLTRMPHTAAPSA